VQYVETLDDLHAAYGTPGRASLVKVTDYLTPAYHSWIARSRLCILSTIGPEGTDASPRGDDSPVVRILDPRHVALPDWRGNERLDSLRNVIRDPRVSLMFLIAGSDNVIRINGTARITTDPDFCASFARDDKVPRSITIVQIVEVYAQCARALLRSRVWRDGDQSAGLPSIGDMLREITDGGIDGAAYDAEWPGRAAKTMW
jgi:PPOX class probable FMN-dependent enzyme